MNQDHIDAALKQIESADDCVEIKSITGEDCARAMAKFGCTVTDSLMFEVGGQSHPLLAYVATNDVGPISHIPLTKIDYRDVFEPEYYIALSLASSKAYIQGWLAGWDDRWPTENNIYLKDAETRYEMALGFIDGMEAKGFFELLKEIEVGSSESSD